MCHPNELSIGFDILLESKLNIFSTISSGNSFFVFQPKSISSADNPASVFAISSKLLLVIILKIFSELVIPSTTLVIIV